VVKRVLHVSTLVLISIFLLAACSMPAAPKDSAKSADTSNPGDSAKPADSVKPSDSTGKEITVATGSDPITLDPRKTWSGPGYSINSHVFEPLVFRTITDGKVKLEGVLAEKFENTDPLTWKFTLKTGVKFHNGAPFNAEAVKFTIETILDPNFNSNLKTWLRDVDKVTTEGDSVVYIKTKTPTRGLVSSLVQVPIVEPGAVKSLGDAFNTKPVGTGPYQVSKYTPNNEVLLERFKDYWGKPGVSDRVRFRIMPENAVRLAALQRGEVQIAETISPDKINTVKNDPNLDVSVTKTLRVDFLVLNLRKQWLSNVKFRQALSLAIDRKSLVDNVLGGTTIPASSVSPPGTIGFNDSLQPYKFDLNQAKTLLKEVGYDGAPIKMGAPIGRYAMDKQMGEAVAGMLKNAGINVQLETLEWSSYIPKTLSGAYDFYFIGATDFTINPSKHWDGYFYSKTSEGGYNNPKVDALMEEAIQTIDDNKAAELYKQIQAIVYEENPTIPLYYEPQILGVSKGLTGFSPRLDEYVMVRDAEMKK
jgi:peptide/nickel transport system substrate-binding protein